jgi:hypothetical protein
VPSAFAGTPVALALAGYGGQRVAADQIAALRQIAGPGAGQNASAGFLKHADEQTVVALAAVFQAIHDHGLGATDFSNWGVVAAPRFLGRATLAVSLQRFALEGAWGVSPHVIPHRSLHSISGTVSQALGIHGPNFGVGGGPESASQVFLAAAALISEQNTPGLWVLVTGWDPEPILEKPGAAGSNGHRPTPSWCGAVALALMPLAADWQGPRIQLRPASGVGRNGLARRPTGRAPLQVESLLDALSGPAVAPAVWDLGGSWLELEWAETGAENKL